MSDVPSVFLQWKGTDACLDFRCVCGKVPHFDGYFANAVECPYCGRIYEMPHTLTPTLVASTDFAPQMMDKDEEDE